MSNSDSNKKQPTKKPNNSYSLLLQGLNEVKKTKPPNKSSVCMPSKDSGCLTFFFWFCEFIECFSVHFFLCIFCNQSVLNLKMLLAAICIYFQAFIAWNSPYIIPGSFMPFLFLKEALSFKTVQNVNMSLDLMIL